MSRNHISILSLRLLLLIGLLWFYPTVGQTEPISVEQGKLSAPEWKFMSGKPLNLSGEWEVVWGKLIGPTEFDAHFQGDLVAMPGRWTKSTSSGFKGPYGVATYRVRLELPSYNRDLSFYMVSPNAAWRLYVDDVLVGGNGVVSTNPAENNPNYTSRNFPARSGESVLVLQLANFSHAYGGPGHPIAIWDQVLLQKRLGTMTFYYVLVLGVLFSIGLFHLIFYLADRTDQENGPVHLWFSLLCFILVVRISGVIPYFHIYFPESAYWADLKLAYLSLFVAPSVYLLFFCSAFPDHFPKQISRWIIHFGLVMAIFVLITPENIYTHTRNFSIALNVGVILFTLIFTLNAMRAKRPGSGAILISNFIFFLTAINDAVIYTDNGNGFDLTPFGVLVLGVGYSYALLLRLQRSFHHARHTSRELEILNLELEKQVHHRTRSFKAAAARAENSTLEGARFIAAASHDLRQPLHALAMFNSALKRKARGKAIAGLVEKQGNSITSLSSLLQDTLDTARVETKNLEPVFSEIEMRSLISQLANSFDIQAEKQNIGFKFSCESGNLICDHGMLQRVLSNLLDNALKAARSRIEINANRTPSGWEIRIADDGPGIAAEDANRIFESYVSLRNEEPGAHGGYGLGLYVVNEFTRALGGSIRISSTSKKGSTFLLELPDNPDQKSDIAHLPALESGHLDMAGMQVLAIDDEPDILDAMATLLQSWKCECQIASSLEQAQQHLARDFDPQLLIVDYHLSGTDGLQTIEKLRALTERELPALIVTGATEPSILTKIRSAGFMVLTKPVQPNQLAAILQSYQND